MTDRQINNRIAKLQSIEAQVKELDAQADAIWAELKAGPGEQGRGRTQHRQPHHPLEGDHQPAPGQQGLEFGF